ncbi:aspartate kinase [bacterium]|nr:aspartate kinase [bacterium]
MGLVVKKFGGTSVGNPEKIKNVAKIVLDTKKQGHKVVVVVSAMGDTTDELIELADKITPNPPEREMDMLLATGEQISIALLAMAIHSMGDNAVSFTGPQIGLITDKVHSKAKIQSIGTEKIMKRLDNNEVVIVAGFQGMNEEEDITTLGRGGSDITAVALAAVLKADVCEIYTDVDGVYTADPRIVKNARKLDRISYEEMLELASLGAKVLHSRSVEFAKRYNIDIHVRSSFEPKVEGTIITKEVKDMEDLVVSGVALAKDEAKITIMSVPDKPGIAARIFKTLAENNINVDIIIQNISEDGITDISFTVPKDEMKKTIKTSEEISKQIGAKQVVCNDKIAKLSVVGVGMRRHVGVAAKMFEVLAENNINIQMISTSEIKISCVIDEKLADKALQAVHDKFELGK